MAYPEGLPDEKPPHRGRPKGESSTPVNVRLPDRAYDAAAAQARRAGITVPELTRRALVRYLDRDDDADD